MGRNCKKVLKLEKWINKPRFYAAAVCLFTEWIALYPQLQKPWAEMWGQLCIEVGACVWTCECVYVCTCAHTGTDSCREVWLTLLGPWKRRIQNKSVSSAHTTEFKPSLNFVLTTVLIIPATHVENDPYPVNEHKFVCLARSEAKQTETSKLEQRKVYFRAMQGDGWLVPPTPLNSLKGFSKALLKARWGVRLAVRNLLVWESFVLAAVYIGHIRIFRWTSQGHKCYSPLCNFLSLCDWKSVIPLKVRALRMGFLYVSGSRQHAFTKGAESVWLSRGHGAQMFK